MGKMTISKKKLFSKKVSAGSRTYFFDVKISKEGTKCLVIKESGQGNRETQIMVFEEHISEFRKGLKKALRFIKRSCRRTYSLNQVRRDYPNAYNLWTRKEEYRLKDLYAQNKAISEIAAVLQRKPSAIRSRLKKLEKLAML